MPGSDPTMGRVRHNVSDQQAEEIFQQLYHAAHSGTFTELKAITERSPYYNQNGRFTKRLSEINTDIPNQDMDIDSYNEAMFFHMVIGHYRTTKMPAQIEVYRGVARADSVLRPGDYVTLNRSYARSYIRGKYGSILRNMVNPEDLIIHRIDNYDFNEFIYFPKNAQIMPQKIAPPISFLQFWQQTNQLKQYNWYHSYLSK